VYTKCLATTLIISIICSLPQAVLAHPADGYPPNEMPPAYGTEAYGRPPECNINDLTFSPSYPDPAALTDIERYMIVGCTNSSLGYALQPWYDEVFMAVNAIYSHSDSVPPQLSEELIRSISVCPESVPEEHINIFRNPITGEFPRLDAAEFSPGDVYIRILTPEEREHFAALSALDDGIWDRGEFTTPLGDTIQVELTTEVYYMRVYGLTAPIIERIMYRFRTVE